MNFPQYRKNTSRGETIYVRFDAANHITVVKMSHPHSTLRPWKMRDSCDAQDIHCKEWESWNDNINLPTYNIKEYK